MDALISELLPKLDVLAAKLGVVGEYLWRALIRQTVLSGWLEVAGGLFALLVGVYMFIKLRREARRRLEEGYDRWRDNADEIYVLAGVVLGLGLVFGGCLLADGIQKLVYPEAFALRSILGPLK